MEKKKKEALLNAFGILGIIGGTTALVLLKIFSAWAFVLVAIACIPMVKVVWQYAIRIYNDPIRILRNTLPKIGYDIIETKWNEEGDTIGFLGKYHDEHFGIRASKTEAYILIYDFPWYAISVSDADIPRFLEAMNDVNAESANISVCLGQPDDKGMRSLFTICHTILPTYQSACYLDALLRDMLNRKDALSKALNMERPYMVQRRGPIGFNVQDTSDQAENSVSPAAKNDSNVKN